jgi:hypothetical protein
MDLLLNGALFLGPFHPLDSLTTASTMLVLSLLIALPPGAMTPMYLVLGPLQGTHRSAHC